MSKPIFQHIPKTAGTSLKEFCYDNQIPVNHHDLRRRYRFTHLKDRLSNFDTSFCVVRNPWDRAVSAFFYIDKGGINLGDKLDREIFLSKYKGDFEHFVFDAFERGLVLNQIHFRPQSWWITKRNGESVCDNILRYESLENDLRNFSSDQELNFEGIGHLNGTTHRPFREYYTSSRMVDIIGDAYQEDVKRFNYTFE